MQLPTAVATEDSMQLVDAVLRYYYYIELGVSEQRHVAPFREAWAASALDLVPPEPPSHVTLQFYEGLLRSSLEEMHADYIYAMKKAIVDYVIMCVQGMIAGSSDNDAERKARGAKQSAWLRCMPDGAVGTCTVPIMLLLLIIIYRSQEPRRAP
jgi:hypothetical protein